MRVMKKEGVYVKILIGMSKKSHSNIYKPIKSIIVLDSSVQEVYDKLIKILEEKDDS